MTTEKKKPTGFNLAGKNNKYGFRAIPNESVLWKLQSPDGKYFGDVSYDAYKAIEEGTLDDYKPKSKAEKDIITDFRKHPGIALSSADGAYFGNISYDTCKALEGGIYDDYDLQKGLLGNAAHRANEKPFDGYVIPDGEKGTVVKYVRHNYAEYAKAQVAARKERVESNPVTARYDIDPENFGKEDFANWMDKHNIVMGGDPASGFRFHSKARGWLGLGIIGGDKLATDQEVEDASALYELVENNERKKKSQEHHSGVEGFLDWASKIIKTPVSGIADASAAKRYEEAGLSPYYYTSPSEGWQIGDAKHLPDAKPYVQKTYEVDKYGKGNIDLTARPVYTNEDGSISTVRSMSINEDGKEVLIPTIVKDEAGNAKLLTGDEAIEHYRKTGEYLGKFDTIEEANAYAEKLHYEQSLYYAPTPEKDSIHSWLGKNTMAGLTSVAEGVGSTLDFITPGTDPVTSSIKKTTEGWNEYWGQEARKSNESLGWEVAGEVLSATVATLPDLALAYFTAGGSKVATAGKAAATASKMTKAQKVATVAKTMAKNPSFWYSFARTVGNDYEAARADGASEFVATSTALLTSLINAGVEVGGGIQNLPNKSGRAIRTWVKTALEEGREEVVQSLITNSIAKLTYDSDRKVIDLYQMGKEFALGAAVGGLLGGGKLMVESAINHKNAKKVGKNYNKEDAAKLLIAEGLTFPEDSQAFQMASKLDAKRKSGKSVSNAELGMLVFANADQVAIKNREAAEVYDDVDAGKTKKAFSYESVAKPMENPMYSYMGKVSDAPADNTASSVSGASENSVAVGDVFRDTKTGNIITVISRDGENTTIEINTSKKRETKVFKNSQADNLSKSAQFEQIKSFAADSETSTASTPPITTSFIERTSAVDAKETSVHDKAVTVANAIAKHVASIVGTKGDKTPLIHSNATILSSENALITPSYVSDFADFFAQSHEANKTPSVLRILQEGIDLKAALVQFALGEQVPEEVLNNKDFQMISADFQRKLNDAIKMSAVAHRIIYGENSLLNAQVASYLNGNKEVIGVPPVSATENSIDTSLPETKGKSHLHFNRSGDIIETINLTGAEENGIDARASIPQNGNGYSESQAGGEEGSVRSRSLGNVFERTGLSQAVGGRHRTVETRTLETAVNDKNFKRLSHFVGDELTVARLRYYSELYFNDTRLTEEEYDFSDVLTYDMLTNPDNALRELFTDNIAEYFSADDQNTDIAGNAVDENVRQKLSDSVVKNENGQLIPVYHSTDKAYVSLQAGDIGIHFGSYAQAKQRAEAKDIENPTYIKAYLNITHPLEINSDFFGWNAAQIAQKLADMGVITLDDAVRFVRNRANAKAENKRLADILKSKGYDGIIYQNKVEAASGQAYIVFDNSQIVRVAEAHAAEVDGRGVQSVSGIQRGRSTSTAENRGIEGEVEQGTEGRSEEVGDDVRFALEEADTNKSGAENVVNDNSVHDDKSVSTFGRTYSYNDLTGKSDMAVTTVDSMDIYNDKGEFVRKEIAEKGLKNVRNKNNPQNTESQTFVFVPDVGKDILVNIDSLRHGLTRKPISTATVTTKIGDILEHSIKVNELNSRGNTSGGYVLLGIASDENNHYYPVRMIVNNYSVDNIEVLDVLYAVNAKKKNQSPNGAGSAGNPTPLIKGSSTISIADLLELVKNDFSDVLSDDVLHNLGVSRKESVLSKSIKYSDVTTQNANMNAYYDDSDVFFALEDDVESAITGEDVKAIQSVGKKSVNEFTSEDIQKTEAFAKKYYAELGEKSPFFRAWFGDWRAYDTSVVTVVEIDNIALEDAVMANGDYSNADTGWNIHAGALLVGDTKSHSRGERISVKMLSDITNILENAVLLDTEISERNANKKSPGTAFMHKLYAPVRFNGTDYVAKITVEEFLDVADKNIKRRGYNLRAIKIEAADRSFIANMTTTTPQVDSASTISVSDLFKIVKRYDKNFQPKPVHKALLNADGTPKMVHHGTNQKMTSFDLSHSGKNWDVAEGLFFFTNTDEDVKAIQSVGKKSVNEFTSEDIQKTEAFAKKYYAELGEKSPFFRAWFGDWRAHDTSVVTVVDINSVGNKKRGIVKNTDTGFDINVGSLGMKHIRVHLHNSELSNHIISNLDTITKNAILLNSVASEPTSSTKHKNTMFMHELYLPVSYDGRTVICKLFVEEYYNDWNKNIQRRDYDISKITTLEDANKVRENYLTPQEASNNVVTVISVSDLFKIVKRYDKNFQPKPVHKALLNADGTPKVVYRGTNQKITSFDLSHSGKNWDVAEGLFFFTNKKDAYPHSASDYAKNTVGNNGGSETVEEVYLNIKKPLRLDSRGYYSTNEYFDRNSEAIYHRYLAGDYDGIIIENSDKSSDDGVLYAVDDSRQVKSVENIGTFHKYNPDVRFDVEDAVNIFSAEQSSINDFHTQIAKWQGGSLGTSEVFQLGNTPYVLQALGADDLPVVMAQNVMEKITGGKHDVDIDTIKDIPQAMADPIMVFRSNTIENAFVILTELTDKNGNDIVVAMHLNKGKMHHKINRISSVYGKDNIVNFVQKQAEIGNLKYIEKQKSQLWSQSRGLQLPKLADTNSGSTNIILQKEDIINSFYEKNSESEVTEHGRGNDILLRNGRRGIDARAGEQAGRISENERGNKERTEAERKVYAEELKNGGRTEVKTVKGVRVNVVAEAEYNEEMRGISEELAEKGLKARFFVGSGHRAFDAVREFLISGFVSGDEVYIRYDGKTSPHQIKQHEIIHAEWNTDKVQAAKKEILGSLTAQEQKQILNQGRYRRYMRMYKGDTDLVLQEFVCDTLSGMNDYAQRFLKTANAFWGAQNNVDSYDVLSYTESSLYPAGIDSGGNVQHNRSAIERGEKHGYEQNRDSKELGRDESSSQAERHSRVASVGHVQQKASNTPNTKRVHRSGVSAEILTSSGLIDTPRTKDTKIKYSPNGLKMSKREYAKLQSSISTDYYNKNKTHEGLQYQSVVDDKSHTLYVYEDGGFDRYNVLAKIDYANETVALAVMEEIDHGTHDRVSSLIDSLIERNEFRQGSYTFYNVSTKKRRRQRSNDTVSKGKSKRNTERMYASGNGDGRNRSGNGTGGGIKFALDENEDILLQKPETEEDLQRIIDTLLETYDALPKSENPARDVSVSKKIAEDKPVSQFARTMMEAGVTPDETVSEFERMILDGTMTHEVITDKSAEDHAKRKIEELGFEDAMKRFEALSDEGKVDKNSMALGMMLYNTAITNQDTKTAMKLATDLVSNATKAGQALQATRMLKLMTPDGQLYYIEKSVQRFNEELREKLGKRFRDSDEIKIDEELARKFLEATDEEVRNTIYDELCQNIADQIPSKLGDKLNSWRYLSMLGNPRTHIRNIVGNAVFYPSVRVKNYIGAALEKTMRVKAQDRTKSMLKSKEAKAFAKQDVLKMEKTLKGQNAKYAITDDIEGKRNIYKSKPFAWLEKARKLNFDALEAEDWWFLRSHYEDALARVITARKLNTEFLQSGTKEANAELTKVRDIAIKEAQAATYRDANAAAEAFSSFKARLAKGNKGAKVANVFFEGLMPFTKTPANILKQGVYYSPVGLVRGIYQMGSALRSGNVTTTEAINSLAQGLTGTGILILGMFLKSLGIIKGRGDDDKKKSGFDSLVGEQDYALVFGDKSYTIDWAAPISLPLFVGVEVASALEQDGFSFADVIGAMEGITDPMLELSVLQGISSTIASASYSQNNPLTAVLTNMTQSYIGQFFPTLGGQVARTIDDKKRLVYYADKTSSLPAVVQTTINQVMAKIPGFSRFLLPQIDQWGREKSYGGTAERFLENTISPGYYSEANYTAVDRELSSLYGRTGENAVLPSTPQKSVTVDKVKYDLNPYQYTEFSRIRGQRAFENVQKCIESGKYKNADDEKKIKLLKECYSDAQDYAKEELFARGILEKK